MSLLIEKAKKEGGKLTMQLPVYEVFYKLYELDFFILHLDDFNVISYEE